MPSMYSQDLRLQLIGQGEQDNQWGTSTNSNWDLIEAAVAGIATVTVTGNVTVLTAEDSPVADQSRCMILYVTDAAGAPSTQPAVIQTPAGASKMYIVYNACTICPSIEMSCGTGGSTVIITSPQTYTGPPTKTFSFSKTVWTDGDNYYEAQNTSSTVWLELPPVLENQATTKKYVDDQVAGIAGVIPQPDTNIPQMDGIGFAGQPGTFTLGEHIHPTDTSRAPIESPAFVVGSGGAYPATPTPPVGGGANNTTIANCGYVWELVSGGGSEPPAGGYLPLSGGTLTGNLTLASSLTANNGAGSAGQVLASTGTGVTWVNQSGGGGGVGYNCTWQSMSASSGQTSVNTFDVPLAVSLTCSCPPTTFGYSTPRIIVVQGGQNFTFYGSATSAGTTVYATVQAIVPPGCSYQVLWSGQSVFVSLYVLSP